MTAHDWWIWAWGVAAGVQLPAFYRNIRYLAAWLAPSKDGEQ